MSYEINDDDDDDAEMADNVAEAQTLIGNWAQVIARPNIYVVGDMSP